MRHRPSIRWALFSGTLLLGTALAASAQTTSPVFDVPRTISYQGLLSSDGIPFADGDYRITVTLYTDQEGNQPLWQSIYTTPVSAGIFNILLGQDTPLPNSEAMNKPLWIGTSINGRELRPLTPLTASPYALNVPDKSITTAKLDLDYISEVQVNGEKVSSKGTVLNLVGTPSVPLSYDKATQSLTIGRTPAQTGDKEKGTSTLVGGPIAWSVGGDGYDVSTSTGYTPVAGDWIGTQGGTDFLVQVSSTPVMNYQVSGLGVPNIVGGDASNTTVAASVQGSIIAEGRNNTINIGEFDVIGGGEWNTIAAAGGTIRWGVIGGGLNNVVDGDNSTIGGGDANTVQSRHSTIGGGKGNTIGPNVFECTIGGGLTNVITAPQGTIAGGYDNQVNAYLGTVGGGKNNILASQSISTISGGLSNYVDANGATIGGGSDNMIVSGADFGTIGGGLRNVLQGGFSTIPGGDRLTTAASYAQTAVGFFNDNRNASMPLWPNATQIAASNEALFIVGNGDVNVATGQSNAFEVAYNGHSKVFKVNGTGAVNPALEGATYVDNVMYAWANVAANGTINSDFGIGAIAHVPGSGVYTVTFNYVNQYTGNAALNDIAVTATINDPTCGIITVVIPPGPTTTFTVHTFDMSCTPTDYSFVFHMTGRP